MELTLDEALKQGVEAQKAGQIQEANKLYTAILKAQPNHPDANHNMGVLAVGVGKIQQALPFFKTALEANPNLGQFWLSYIDALIKLGRVDEAKAVFNQAKAKGAKGERFDQIEVNLNCNNETSTLLEVSQLIKLALVHREAGEFETAIKILSNRLHEFSNSAELLLLLAHCYILNDDAANAAIYLNKAKEIDPYNESVGWNNARLFLKKKDVSNALVLARQTIAQYPNSIEGFGILGACLRVSGEINESLLYLDKAISLNPNYAEALVNRGLIKLTQKDMLGALSDLETAHNLKPHIRQIWGLVISLNLEFKEFDRAISLLLKMVKDDPDNEKNFLMLAFCYQNVDDLDSAINSYKQALKIKPDYAEAYNNMGIVLYGKGDLEAAIESYKQALKIDPDYAEAHINAGIALKGSGDLEAAINSYEKAIKINPDYKAYYNMGVALNDKGDLGAAINSYKQAVLIKSDDAEAYNNMGIALKDKGDRELAIVSYQKALKINPDFSEAHHNLGVLLFESNSYGKAIEHFKLSNFEKSKYFLLRCLYLQNKRSLFYDQLNYFINKGDVHPMIGSLVCRSSLRYGVERPNLFCNDPLYYVSKTDLKGQYDFENIFVKTAKTILNKNNVQSKSQGLLTNGYQTGGNLFSLEWDLLKDISDIIKLEVQKYLDSFKHSKEGLITNWPTEYSLKGWLISMSSGGSLKPHMHENGWISGSIYINVPPKSNSESGNLVVCIEDDQLISEKMNQRKSVDVVTGSLCLFPASLLHYTIPFESEKERIVLAFDVVPKYQTK